MTKKVRVEMELVDGGFKRRVGQNADELKKLDGIFHKLVTSQSRAARANQAVSLSMRSFYEGASRASSSLADVERRSKSLLSTMRDVSIVVGAASMALSKIQSLGTGWAAEIIKVNAEFERLGALMKGMSSAADPVKEAGDNVRYLRDMARNTPFALSTISDAFVKMKATGIDPLDGSLRAFTDAVAAVGGSDEMMKRVSIAISQMSGKGVIQMEELRQQLGEAIPRATELMARSMGVTYSELVDKLSTGRVEAKAALKSLRDELLLTFGGAGERMMHTFNGLIAKTKSLLMDLSQVAGDSGYFAAVKQQLSDLNSFLQTDTAKKMANELGEALARIVNVIRGVINLFVHFRHEIVSIGQVLAVAFGAKIVFSALGRMTAALGAASRGWRNLRQEMLLFQRNQKLSSIGAAIGSISQGAVGISKTTQAVRTLRGAFGLLSSAAGVVSPLLPLLGGAVLLVADQFGIFSDKTRDAWQELEKYGAVSRAQVAAVRPLLDEKRKQLMEAIEKARMWETRVNSATGVTIQEVRDRNAANAAYYRNQVNRLSKDLEQLNKQINIWDREAISNEASPIAAREVQALQERLGIMNNQYDLAAREQDNFYKEEQQRLIAANQDTTKLSEQHRQEQYELRRTHLDKVASLLSDEIARQRKILATGSETEIAAANKVLETILQMERSTREALKNLSVSDGIKLTADAPNLEKSLKKAETLLDNLRSKAVEYRNEFMGASGEVEALRYEMEELQRFGNPGTEKVQEYIEKIIQAQTEVSELKELMDGKTKFERDLERERLRAQEALFEAQNKGLTDFEKFQKKIQTGFYKGIGKSDQERVLEAMTKGFRQTGKEAQKAGNVAAATIFGKGMMRRATGFLDVVNMITGAFARMKSIVTGLSLDEVMRAAQGGSFSLAGEGPAGRARFFGSMGKGDYYDKLIGRESGGDPNARARTSSAVGLGQFTKGTWNEFIKATRPEMFSMMSGDAIQALRTNTSMMTEAIQWLTQKNARTLAGAGLDTNDANLYLAHFLGSGDAIKVLRSSLNTNLAGLIDPDSISANKSVLAGKSVGDLMYWVQQKFGTGHTARVGSAPDRQSPFPYADNYNEGSRVDLSGVDLLPEYRREMDQIEKSWREVARITSNNNIEEEWGRIQREIMEATEEVDGYGKKEAALRKAIREGRLDGADRNPDSDRYAQLMEHVKKLDEAETRLSQKRKLRTDQERMGERQREIELRKQEALRQLNQNPNGYQPSSAYYNLESEYNEMLLRTEQLYGRESEMYRQLQQEKLSALQNFKNAEIAAKAQGIAQEVQSNKYENMSAAQARQARLQDEIASLQTYLQNFKGTAEERVRIEAAVQARIAQLRQQASVSGPLGQQMKQWSDFGANMEQAMTGWLDGGIDAIANFVATGKADFKSLIQSIIKDITKLALKWAISKMFAGGGKGGAGGGKGGGGKAASAGAKAATGGKSLPIPFFHTGGIIGAGRARRGLVSASAFAGAPRFHTGGLVGGQRLASDEVPIIAQKGEGVFTREQMAAMGGMGGTLNQNAISLNTNVTVNASGGTPEANADLAKQVSKAVEGQVRQMVVKELLIQRKPGGMLGSK